VSSELQAVIHIMRKGNNNSVPMTNANAINNAIPPFKVAPEPTLWPPDPKEPVPSVPLSDKSTGPPPLRGPKGGLQHNLDHVKLFIAFALVTSDKSPVTMLEGS
jgi:hypothetical protein